MKTLLLSLLLLFGQTLLSQEFNGTNNLFIENKGQLLNDQGDIAEEIFFYNPNNQIEVFFKNDGISFVIKEVDYIENKSESLSPYSINSKSLRYDVNFVDCNFTIPTASEKSDIELNYYLGYLPEYAENVQLFEEIHYNNIYDNIDLIFKFKNGKLKYDIVLKNNAKIKDLKFKYSGIEDLYLKNDDLFISTKMGLIKERIPLSYELKNNTISKEININYKVVGNEIRFFGKYNTNNTLVIDPEVEWITFVGGSNTDILMRVDTYYDNSILVGGLSRSTNYPTTTGAIDNTNNGNFDYVVSRFTPLGELIYSTYIGSSAGEGVFAIGYDSENNIWVGGDTQGSNFPTTNDAFDRTFNGGSGDGILLKISEEGQLLYSTYFGGASYDATLAIVTKDDYVFFGGRTQSTGFPSTPNAFQEDNAGDYDGYFGKVNIYTNEIELLSFVGSNLFESIESITLGEDESVVLGIMSTSEDLGFDNNTYQQLNRGFFNGVIAKVDENNGRILDGTFFGGTVDDKIRNIDYANGVYAVSGNANSTLLGNDPPLNFTKSNQQDYFIATFDDSFDLIWYNFVGGNNTDGVTDFTTELGGVVINEVGNIAFSGRTLSSDFPTTPDAFQTQKGNLNDAFLTVFNTNGNLLYSTFFGGNGDDTSYYLDYNDDNDMICVGWTNSADFPVTSNAFQRNYGGNTDGFIVKFGSICLDIEFDDFDVNENLSTYVYNSRCAMIPIKNNSDTDILILADDIEIDSDVNFSVSPAQFPISVPAGQTALLEVCFVSFEIGSFDNQITISLPPNCEYNLPISADASCPELDYIAYANSDTIRADINIQECDLIEIFNLGDSDLTITQNDVSLTEGSNFSIPEDQFPITVPANGSAFMEVCFLSAEVGEFSDEVMFTFFEICSNQLDIYANALFECPNVIVGDFDSEANLSSFVNLENCALIELVNNDDEDIILQADNVQLRDGLNYEIPAGQFPLTVPAGGTVFLEVCFLADAIGSFEDVVTIILDDDCLLTSDLSANSSCPDLSFGPFDSQELLTSEINTMKCDFVDIFNNGESDIVLNQSDVVLDEGSIFQIPAGQFPITVPAGGSAQLEVCFYAEEIGEYSDELLLSLFVICNNQLQLTANATFECPDVDILTFDSQELFSGDVNSEKCAFIELSNNESEEITIQFTDVRLSSGDKYDIPAGQFPITIPAGGTAQLEVCFFSDELGNFADSLRIDFPNFCFINVNLDADANCPDITFAPFNPEELLSTELNSLNCDFVEIVNNGNSAVVINQEDVVLQNGGNFQIPIGQFPITVPAGGVAQIEVCFFADVLGDFADDVRLTLFDLCVNEVPIEAKSNCPEIFFAPFNSEELLRSEINTMKCDFIDIVNNGINDVTINQDNVVLQTGSNFQIPAGQFPITVPAGGVAQLEVCFYSDEIGNYADNITLTFLEFCTNSIPLNTSSFYVCPQIEFVPFDSDSLLSGGVYGTKCGEIEIVNFGDAEVSIDLRDAYLSWGVDFSMPSSQFPIVIQPNSSAQLQLCFTAHELTKYYDRLNIYDDEFCAVFLDLVATGEENLYNEDAKCETELELLTLDPQDITEPIFPIPADNILNLRVDLVAKYDQYIIYDNLSRPVLSGEVVANINLESLSPGIYFLRLMNDFDQFHFKIIIAR